MWAFKTQAGDTSALSSAGTGTLSQQVVRALFLAGPRQPGQLIQLTAMQEAWLT